MELRDHIRRHYENIWISRATVKYFYKGPIHKLNPDFCVLEFPPAGNQNVWTYATCCMSTEREGRRIELHLFSATQDATLIELLTVTASYHKNDANLGLHHTVNFGRPWQNNSQCTYGFISLPYLDGPELEDLAIPGTDVVHKFYWLIPVTKAEVEFKKKYGVEELEQRFELEKFNYVDPYRESVV